MDADGGLDGAQPNMLGAKLVSSGAFDSFEIGKILGSLFLFDRLYVFTDGSISQLYGRFCPSNSQTNKR